MLGAKLDELPGSRSVAGLRARYERTLADRPWKQCPCAICQSLSIEVVIFRASNRNKRRGIHNLGIYKALIDSLPASSEHHDNIELLGDTSSSKSGTHSSVIRRSRVRTKAVCGDLTSAASRHGKVERIHGNATRRTYSS